MEIKNLRKVARRILKGVKKRERIILYGDTDLDGVASVIILKEALKNLNYSVLAIYFPDRELEGYGITEIGLNSLKKFAPALLVALDLGISNFKEIKIAKKMGFEVIVVDHHEILDKLPAASIIVDPKQPDDKYPFKGLATAGIVFKLAEVLLQDYYPSTTFRPKPIQPKKELPESLRKNFLELAALATLADMMPREEENRIFIEEGLTSIEKSFRPGIRTFFEMEPLKKYNNFNQKIAKIISILNIRDVEQNLPAPFRLLTAISFEEARLIIEKLLAKVEERRERIKAIVEEIERRISQEEKTIIFEGDSDWELTFLSSVASFLCQKYQKPAFIFKKLEKESQGTVRSPAGLDSVRLMKKCKRYLITFGGHPQASGFRSKNENLEKFEECLIKNLTA